ncbi:lytic polysaccharide monooxygenase auxiliary activity family 9 protein [Streptomyces candidus]|uniref:Chitin-binding protein n=1 Tax=Streptomyces candidus TaxID=67283 RepID=A0A7X0HFE3_9ACTN|nr:lytic polysaccharide monooxygenase [Streptomyces candidus]MBB6436526.1 chitin-binding protein [Streptomyces candidus]GHH49276.1 chitin-binding protein [Streptomyces candidus]
MTTARRKAATVAALGLAPLALTGLAASPAAAHGSMTDPVSRVSACYAEGPESPDSAACKAAVAASGVQAFYDWNAVNIANAAGNHKALIPDGKLCSAGNDKYKGLDLPRADWPSSKLTAGKHTFRYKGTAPHKGSFDLYVTKDGYDPAKPLKWSDLEAKPFASVTDPRMEAGDYVFEGTLPKKSGRHLVYSVWQRSDSPEAFYTCSDVVFGKDTSGTGTGGATAPVASAPSDKDIAAGADKSTVEHQGHGDDDHTTNAGTKPSAPTAPEAPAAEANVPAPQGGAPDPVKTPTQAPAGAPADTPAPAPAGGENLAETGGDGSTPYLAVGGAAVLALGAALLFGSVRRKAAAGGRHGR